MKNYQAKKALSVLLAVLMLLTSVYAGLGVIASAASVELNTVTALEDGTVYTVTTDTAITGGTNGLSIPANATVIIESPRRIHREFHVILVDEPLGL